MKKERPTGKWKSWIKFLFPTREHDTIRMEKVHSLSWEKELSILMDGGDATQEAKHEHPARQKEKSPAAKPSPEKETVPKEPELSKRGERYARRRRGLSPDIYSTQYYKSTADEELFNTRSEYRRPPAILSRSNKLTVIFTGHDFTQLVGFRARYEFVENLSWPDKPTRRNCDDFLESYGGQISLDSQKTLLNKNIDCIWLIGRFPALSRTFDKIYLKVQEFQLKGVGLRLEVRRGPSSTAERVLMLFDEQLPTQLERKQPLEGLITEDHIQPAFYVRLRGYLTINTGLNIVYTQFYRWATALCPGGDGEFHCDNSKCIKSALQCDGFDHCGDASDEVCHLPDIQFEPPKIDVAGILTLVIGATGIIVLMLTMLAILSKLYRHGYFGRRRGGRGTAADGHVVATTSASAMAQEAFCNELAPTIQTIGERRFYILPENQLNIIEAPPTYDTALKHPKVPDNGNQERLQQQNRRSRSAMAYVYTNEGYHRSPDDNNPPLSPPPFEETIEPSTMVSPGQQRHNHKRISSPPPPPISSSRSHSNPPHLSTSQQIQQLQQQQPPPYPSSSPPPPSTRTPTPLPSQNHISSSSSSPTSPPQSSRSAAQNSTTTFSPLPPADSSKPETSRSSRSGDDESWV
uniref:CUB domain-containing protein n=1 Tax=Panagrolaimus sp. ES5 TaxID=591445 RepID=A0AC34F4U8_9BILA